MDAKTMIAVIDYGSGNVGAISNMLRQRRIAHVLTADNDVIAKADKYILPGVGAFDPTMELLRRSGIVDVLNVQVLEKRKPVMGICVGMHVLAEGSDEGSLPGLGWIKGQVRQIDASRIEAPPKLPHLGWNGVSPREPAVLFDGVDRELGFYFLHSYFLDAENDADVAAHTTYGGDITCAVERENIFGVQFHPEKSHNNGARLFENFANLT